MTLTALSPAASGKGGTLAAGCGRLKIWGWAAKGGCTGAWGLSLGGVTCRLGPLPWPFPGYLLGWGQKYIPCPSSPQL